jgi:N-acetylmuramoyl-L-alanine amidase
MDDGPLPAIALALSNNDGQAILSRTDSDGSVRFDRLKSGGYRLSLNELDQDSWNLISERALDANAARSDPGDAAWGALRAPESSVIKHTIKEGEGTTKVADSYGFFADTVWNASDNSALKDKRKDMNILYPGDVLVIPAKRTKWIDVSPGSSYRIQRKGIPAALRVRFLTGEVPRAGIDYFMCTETSSGDPIPDRQGTTDDGGWVNEPLPPSAVKVTITLATDPEQEEYEFEIGQVNPIDTVSGLRARLVNLGYSCGDENGEELGELTKAALSAFQGDYGLTITGKADSATRDALQQAFQS